MERSRKSKKLFALVMVLALVLSSFTVVFAFPDIDDSFAKNEINTMKVQGIVTGFTDGSFRPVNVGTRAHLAKILVLFKGLDLDEAAADIFTDIDDDYWAKGYIGAAVGKGLMTSVSDRKFAPRGTIKREEFAVILISALGLEGTATTLAVKPDIFDFRFTEASNQNAVGLAYELGLLNTRKAIGRNLIQPKSPIRREEMVWGVYEVVKNKEIYIQKAQELLNKKTYVEVWYPPYVPPVTPPPPPPPPPITPPTSIELPGIGPVLAGTHNVLPTHLEYPDDSGTLYEIQWNGNYIPGVGVRTYTGEVVIGDATVEVSVTVTVINHGGGGGSPPRD